MLRGHVTIRLLTEEVAAEHRTPAAYLHQVQWWACGPMPSPTLKLSHFVFLFQHFQYFHAHFWFPILKTWNQMQRHAGAEDNSIVMSAAVSAHWTMTGFGFVRDFSRMAGKFLIECATLAAAAALCCYCYGTDIETSPPEQLGGGGAVHVKDAV